MCWVVKYRRSVLNPGVQAYLRKLFPKLIREMPGVEIEELGMARDHLHMVVLIPPKYAVSDVIARLKSRSASQLRKKFSWLGKVFWKENVVWSVGYFVSGVGVDEKRIKRYVEWQGKKDSGQAQVNL